MDIREKATNDKRLIDADALRSYMDECSKESRFRVYYGYAESFINAAPTVDAVEVVRCRECKHYGWEQEPCHGRIQRFCRLHKGLVCVTKDSFCSHGERRSE